jgi:uncharacterized protein (DUF1800 family)
MNAKYDQLRETATKNKLALYNFCIAPAVHDDGVKTVLGKTGRLDGDDVLDIASAHPATAQFICRKIWSWFAYANPEQAVVDRLVAAWKKSDGDVSSVIKTMTEVPEFWSTKCVRQMPKSPLDFTVSMFRALEAGDAVLKARGNPFTEFTPLSPEARQAGQSLNFLMRRQGFAMLYPPNVGGWSWGPAWITAQNVAYRLQHSSQLFLSGGKQRLAAVNVAAQILESNPADSKALVLALADVLDAQVPPTALDELAQISDSLGGVKALSVPESAAKLLAGVSHVLFAVPEYQLC